jgi:hypothetical protein
MTQPSRHRSWIDHLLRYSLILLVVSCRSDYEVDEMVAARLPETVDFNFHIKPILSDRCFSCHGPDRNAVKADLQLHTAAGAREQRLSSGQRAFAAGNIHRSEAFQRIISKDPERQMPPPEFERKLNAYEIALIARWIEQGAAYEPHWAFIPPSRPAIPRVSNTSWPRDTIDHFILKQLEEGGRQPKGEAEKETLIRRVTLDLTGLPPTIAEIDAFVEDQSPDALEKVVDRLLAAPHFGERLALFWLDLARYADSNGYSQDGLRLMWPWRDWVIEAFNKNMPYDQFIRRQIAGDKLPEAGQEERLATAFLRNHRLNGEGGIIDEEYRVEYVADRTETAATVFLGLTMQCARCHDHKYDPISQEEYYQFFSFFNSVHESGIAANDINSGPEVVLTPKEVAERIAFIDEAIAGQEKAALELADRVSPSDYEAPEISLEKDLILHLSFDDIRGNRLVNQVNTAEVFTLPETIAGVAGAQGRAIRFTAFDFVALQKESLGFDRADAFSFSFYLKLEKEHEFVSVLNHLGSSTINYPGYEVAVVEGYPMIRLVHSLPANVIEVRATEKIKPGAWIHFTFTYDGSGKARGIDLFRNGARAAVSIRFDKLTQGMASGRQTLTIGGMMGYQTITDGAGSIDELKIYQRRLSAIEARLLYRSEGKSTGDFAAGEKKQHYLLVAHQPYRAIRREIRRLRKEKFQIEDTLTSVMVMEDLPEPRPTFVLERGQYDAPGKPVYPATPNAILPFPETSPADRAGLADWLLDERHPLTARVAVNRFWQLLFGRGIVKTSEDFGSQGDLPSHPELLDWLAIHFRESGWDVKALLKRIVLSATYRQSSRADAAERAADPDNQWLARGPAGRLPAELIRDVALSASGLLVKKVGGPSVKPYQPAGLWEEKGEFSQLKYYEQSHGDDLYRRGLYTFWRRTSPPPSMTIFDAPTRDICTVNRQATNTPLQALVLLNDPQFVEAARVLAERVMREQSGSSEQIVRAYRLLTSRRPEAKVLRLLLELKKKETLRFRQQPDLARELLQVGEWPADTSLTTIELAAMTVVCSAIMSFDECLVKR